MPAFNITGLASGLDTSTMITELMRLERLPVDRYEQRQSELRKVDDAWGAVNTKLSAVRSAIDELRKPGAFNGFVTSTSSDETAATVTATGKPAPGAMSFTVTQLARSHQFAFAEVGAADASLWSGAPETLSLTKGGETYELTTDSSTTLSSLAADINGLDAGLSAQVVQTSPGAYRLVVSASESGTANAVTVNGAPAALGATTDLQAAADAVLDLGGGVTVTRSSNKVTDLVAGVTVDLKKADAANPVTVTTGRDLTAAKEAVKKLVSSVNSTLSTLKTYTAYNAETKAAGVLQGNPTARKLMMDLRTQMSSAVAGLTGDHTTPGSVGISLTRDGQVRLDETKLNKALEEDFAGVATLFAHGGSSTNSAVRYSKGSAATAAGDYTVEVTQAAQVASITGAAYSPPTGSPKIFTVSRGDGTTASISIDADMNLATAVSMINTQLSAAGLSGVRAKAGTTGTGDEALVLEATEYGAHGTFTVDGSGDWGLDGTHAGADVQGTIGGLAATGRGRTLTGSDGAATGLVLEISATAPGSYGSVTYQSGIGGAIDSVLVWAEGDKRSTDPYTAIGAVRRARDTLSSEIRRFDDQIAAFEVRLASREETLRKKFAAMESALANAQSQSSWITGMMTSGMA